MVVAKLKLVAVAGVSLSLLGVGGGMLTRHASAERQTAGEQVEEPKPTVQVAVKPKPVEKLPARTDRYGDPLPDGAIGRLGTVRFRQDLGVSAAAVSVDG